MATALARAARRDGVAATEASQARTGLAGLFLVAPAPNLVGEILRPGAVVVFVSQAQLRGAARAVPGAQIRASRPSAGNEEDATTSETFSAAGQSFDVVVPRGSVGGAGAVLPWMILAGGLVFAALAYALEVNGARRARAQEELDRIFTLSSDLIAVADFDAYFTRVNPAAKRILGFTPAELLGRRYLDMVHPDDRDSTAAETAAIGQGKATLSFENRLSNKDGSYRTLEWTVTPVVDEGLMYAVGRDVTARRAAEEEVARLADEQAALRHVATLVAEGASPSAVFDAVAGETEALLDADQWR